MLHQDWTRQTGMPTRGGKHWTSKFQVGYHSFMEGKTIEGNFIKCYTDGSHVGGTTGRGFLIEKGKTTIGDIGSLGIEPQCSKQKYMPSARQLNNLIPCINEEYASLSIANQCLWPSTTTNETRRLEAHDWVYQQRQGSWTHKHSYPSLGEAHAGYSLYEETGRLAKAGASQK